MSKMIQIRNVPEDLHRSLKLRATAAGVSLSDYLLRELREAARKPTLEQLFEQVEREQPVDLDAETVVEAIHRGREERSQQLHRAIAETRRPEG